MSNVLDYLGKDTLIVFDDLVAMEDQALSKPLRFSVDCPSFLQDIKN